MNAPILNPSPTLSTASLIDRIYTHISRQPVAGNVSLLSGQMGYALLEAYAHQHYGQTDDNRIWDRISTSLAAVQNGELTHSFASGMAGVGWGFLHLCNHGLLSTDGIDAQDIIADLDEPLFDLSMELLQKGDYDFLHGGLGAGLYYLERPPSPIIDRYISAMVAALSATAVRFPNGDITWRFRESGRRVLETSTFYNPGLSHGTASIAALLSLFYERGYAQAQCAALIQGTLQWIWNTRNRSGRSVFPTLVSEIREDRDSRLSWCYGDLGIASAYWLCGQKLQQANWLKIAYETMLKAAPRRQIEDTNIHDASLCHGSAGTAWLFRRFARQIPHPILTEAADYWMQQTAHYVASETDDPVFLAYDGVGYGPSLSLLDGESSIGLVLLTELGGPTHWERFLLLS